VSWWFAWRTAQHGKDEALRLFTDYLNAFPIPQPTDDARAEASSTITRLRANAQQRQSGSRSVLDWLRVEFAIEKPTQRLAEPAALDADALTAEVKKVRGKKLPLSVAGVKRLKDEHAGSVVPLRALAREAAELERRVSDLVNAAYRLTPADVAMLWDSAPPRMPTARPT
jgi:hypothetical protein